MNIFKRIKDIVFPPPIHFKLPAQYKDYPEWNREKYPKIKASDIDMVDFVLDERNREFCFKKGQLHRKKYNDKRDVRAAEKAMRVGKNWEYVREIQCYIDGWKEEDAAIKYENLNIMEIDIASAKEEKLFFDDGYRDRVNYEATKAPIDLFDMERFLDISKNSKDVWECQIADAYLEGWNKADEEISGKDNYSI